jgi:hypothetical protein
MIDEEVRVVSGTDASLYSKMEKSHRSHPNFKIKRSGGIDRISNKSKRKIKLTGEVLFMDCMLLIDCTISRLYY